MAQIQYKYALLGDVGGTNIRLQLVKVDINQNTPVETVKKDNLLVANFDNFQKAIENFLQGVVNYPHAATIGIAGPIFDNTVKLSNVQKWGTLSGIDLGINLKIPHFKFINDFEAASYGILLVPQQNFVPLNGLNPNPQKMRGVLGPGTGLGNSMLYPAIVKKQKQIIVIPSEGGHTDFPKIDSETDDFVNFLSKQKNEVYISVQPSFCGPAIPYMYKYYSQKYPQDPQASNELKTSEEIISKGVQPNAPRIYQSVVKLLIKIYSSVIGNFIIHHMTLGGVYLVGSLTNSLIPKLKDVDFLADYKARHGTVASIVQKVALLVCKDIDLGLKGAYFVARNLLQSQ